VTGSTDGVQPGIRRGLRCAPLGSEKHFTAISLSISAIEAAIDASARAGSGHAILQGWPEYEHAVLQE